MENEFETMTAAEVAEAIYNCACENAREYEEMPYDCYGYQDPRNAYVAGCCCEDEKLPLGEHITLWISAEFSADGEKCKELFVSVYDGDDDGYERYDAYRDAIRLELQAKAHGANVQVDY